MIRYAKVLRFHCSVCGHVWYEPLNSDVPKVCPKCYCDKHKSWDNHEQAAKGEVPDEG